MIYELLIRDFTGDGTGSGTIAGVIDRLDYIASLGVNAVELMPVMEFGGNNSWGYNPLFYFAPDKAYGTPDDYRRPVNEIHSRGMAVILDVVMNHADSRTPRQLMYEPSQNPFSTLLLPTPITLFTTGIKTIHSYSTNGLMCCATGLRSMVSMASASTS